MRSKTIFLLAAYAVILLLGIWLRSPFFAVPPSLYWEEVALGYDAYSLVETGKDHHGNSWPVVAIESFGDWKPAGYIYFLLPAIKLFGLSDWVVRLPSWISGIAIMIGVSELCVLLISSYTLAAHRNIKDWWLHPLYLRVVSLFVVTVSPWAIMFSKAAWEVNLATALILWAMILLLRAVIHNQGRVSFGWYQLNWQIVTGTVLLILALYTYHAARMIAPLLGMLMIGWWLAQLCNYGKISWKQLSTTLFQHSFTFILILLLSVASLIPFLTADATVVGSRFSQTSIFSDPAVVLESNKMKEIAGDTFFAKLFYHRYVLYLGYILENMLSHFDLAFLFINGDSNPRHSVGFIGHLYYLDLLLIVTGILVGLKNNTQRVIVISWLCIGIIPASLTLATPHALRILPTLPIFLYLNSVGMSYLIFKITEWTRAHLHSMTPRVSIHWAYYILPVGLVAAYSIQFIMFWRYYNGVYPVVAALDWQYGYQQMVVTLQPLVETEGNRTVYITRYYGRPAMYYWFYTQADPRLVQQEDSTALQDQGEYLTYKNIHFVNSLDEVVATPALVAGTPTEVSELQNKYGNAHTVKTISSITSPDGKKTIWTIALVD